MSEVEKGTLTVMFTVSSSLTRVTVMDSTRIDVNVSDTVAWAKSRKAASNAVSNSLPDSKLPKGIFVHSKENTPAKVSGTAAVDTQRLVSGEHASPSFTAQF